MTAASYKARRYRLIAYGRWQPYVDITRTRDHIARLERAGVGRQRIAELAGITTKAVYLIMNGGYRKVRPATEARILAIEPRLENAAPHARILGIGSQRRLQALIANGWSRNALAARLGMNPSNFSRLMQSVHVTVESALKIRRLYDDLWDQSPPADTASQRCSIARAKNDAAARGWAPPLAWDDETIDDPDARPRGVRREGVAA